MNKKLLSLLLIACLWLLPAGLSAADNSYTVVLKDGASLTETQKDYYGLKQLTEADYGFYLTDKEGAQKLKNNTEIESVEPANTLSLFFSPNDTYYRSNSQWGLKAIKMEKAWDITRGNNDVVICVIDSGFDFTHPDKGSRILAGKDYSTDKDSTKDYSYHGTATAGIIGAATDNNLGIAGLCDGCTLYVLTAFNGKTGDDVTVAAAIRDAIDVYHADVISMSFGGAKVADILANAVSYAYDHGAILVASAGNEGENGSPLYYPANYSQVIGVAAVDSTLATPTYSSFNSSVYVCAPGSDIITLVPASRSSSGYSAENIGTSFAAPFVAALAGMARSLDPELTQAEFCNYLKTTATDLDNKGYDIRTGWGLVNFEQCLTAIKTDLEKEKPTPTPTPTPSPVSFTDVRSGAWYYDSVIALAQDMIISGYPDGSFLPDKAITRAEAVKIIAKAAGAETKYSTKLSFKDVPQNAWYYNDLNWAVKNGLIYGKAIRYFCPNDLITRQELSCILVRYLTNVAKLPLSDTATLHFKDNAAIAGWAEDSVKKLTNIDIIHGFEDNTFRPGNTATRAQTAMMINSLRHYTESHLSE